MLSEMKKMTYACNMKFSYSLPSAKADSLSRISGAIHMTTSMKHESYSQLFLSISKLFKNLVRRGNLAAAYKLQLLLLQLLSLSLQHPIPLFAIANCYCNCHSSTFSARRSFMRRRDPLAVALCEDDNLQQKNHPSIDIDLYPFYICTILNKYFTQNCARKPDYIQNPN
jgi:hypothetical protein